jgi:hypothetical protein
MKYVTASEARRNWFRLLDEAANGEVISIQRDDKKLILTLDAGRRKTPNYDGLIDFKDADQADTFGWEWKGPGRMLPRQARKPRQAKQ